MNIRYLFFDWGDTIMRDFAYPGPISLWPELEWIAGAEDFLVKACKRYTCIIATSASHSDVPEMKKALARVGADKYFHHFYSRFELGYSKPDPLFFVQAMHLTKAKPSESMMIGNLYDKDIVGAKNAGMTTVLFNEHEVGGTYLLADYVIAKYSELDKIVNL